MQRHENGYYPVKLFTLPGQLLSLNDVVHTGQVWLSADLCCCEYTCSLAGCVSRKSRGKSTHTLSTHRTMELSEEISAALSPKCHSCMTNFIYAKTLIAIFIHTTTPINLWYTGKVTRKVHSVLI